MSKTHTLKGWVVKDQFNVPYFYQIKPERVEDEKLPECGTWGVFGAAHISCFLPMNWFKELTWESEPVEAELTITLEKAENLPVCQETKESFESAFTLFEKSNPDWRKALTDSTYYELAEWYDEYCGIANKESLSDKAHEFANYIWRKLSL